MLFHSLIIDDFFENPDALREFAMTQNFSEITSPDDGVTYPDICINIPTEVKQEMHIKITQLLGAPMTKTIDFMRLSRQGVHVPHQAHTDLIMGQYTALIYLNKPEDCKGGTSLLKHVNGMDVNPKNDEEEAVWRKDTNDESKWIKLNECPMVYNRLFLVRSDLFHRAEPVGGFGNTLENGRLVLVSFFSL